MRRIRMLFLYGLVIFFILSLTKNIIEYQKNLSFYTDYRNEFTSEKKRSIELKTQLVKTQDINEFEKIVRNKLNLHKADETIMVIPNPTPTIVTPTPTLLPTYRRWLNVFSGR
ncbi:hypothetical protein CO051_04115 [Candidatus Roizmanbacteria bacterium CG_4_9_14_0_2_um_filter_39_13]|uniref:Septum formation initiator n=1 Tax=Candidatus Roizmanbacteria bacterium CG_4_9_14_0_2_um_filter_39_13 TaxID=1974839 RepID=A0A2M8EYG4_9BACT|nr:MAG: hypothetical protein CO051_04115 [Candidatus Roizmanbacteria bacterium CG_4_9_14_0_2_um_filter_39_13]